MCGFQSARKTGRVVVAHEAPRTNGFGAEIAATVQVRQTTPGTGSAHIL